MFKTHWIRVFVLIIVAVGFLVIPGNSGAASRTVTVGIYCLSLGHQRLECHADASGGTGSYTYQWTPTPTAGSQDIVIVRCARAYSYQNVSLTVTDGSGASAGDSTTAFCGDAQ